MAGKRKKTGGMPHLPGRPDPTQVGWQPTWQPQWHPNPQGGPVKGGGNAGAPKPNKGGGGKGGNGGGGKGGGQKISLYDRATNDINVAYQPMLDAIQMSQLQAQQQYADDASRVQSIYGSLLNQLAPLNGQYDQQATGIASDLSNQIGGLAGLLGSNVAGVPSSEIAAGTNAVGAQGTGALEQLATDRSRNLDYNTSAQRQGGIEQMTTSRNYLQDLQDLMDQFSQRGLDITAQMPSLIQSRLGELQDQKWQRRMAKKEFNLRKKATMSELKGNKAFGKFTTQATKGALNQGGGGGGKPYQPSGGGGGGGGTRSPAGDGSGDAVLNHLMGGQTRWNDLTPAQRTGVGSKWQDPQARQQVEQEWMRLFPGARIQIGSQAQFIEALKKISRAKAPGGVGAGAGAGAGSGGIGAGAGAGGGT